MQIGMIGLGRMGAGMTRRLLGGGHDVVAHDLEPSAVAALAADGARGATTLPDLIAYLAVPRVVWVMVPSGTATTVTLDTLADALDPGDLVIDGGNSRWTDSMRHAAGLAQRGIGFCDVGTSGGVWGLEEGFCLMVGGEADAVATLAPALETLAPPDGWAHIGPVGAGHFTKMVHNGIEYALMQAYAEGFALLDASEFQPDLHQVAEVWRHGSVIRSWLLDLAAIAFERNPALDDISGWVEDSGEGRWTLEAAIDHRTPAPTIAAALFARFSSRRQESLENRIVAALRREFGGHATRPAAATPAGADATEGPAR